MNTEWAAYRIFEDHEKGTISPAKFGDLAILSQDPRNIRGSGLFDLEVEATILGGEIVFQA